MNTIFALSSGRPPAAIAIIRISGPDALAAVATMAGSLPAPRQARVRTLRDENGHVLDRALVLVFPGPGSATGEDLTELHCHGGRAVADAVVRALAAIPGLRSAEAGEFTRRALANGRIDLTEAEGLADLLAAETERQRIAAMSAAEGRISRSVYGWMDAIALLAARVEATLDFAEEGDVGADDLSAVIDDMRSLAVEIGAAIAAPPVDRLRDGVKVVLAGPPNSGKSTLINLLGDREVAIVSPIAGTTRDRIEAPVMRGGVPYVLVDTAGLTDTRDEIEKIGVDRAGAAIASADVLLWLGDDVPPRPAIWLHTRADLPARGAPQREQIAVSRDRPQSIDALWETIEGRADDLLPSVDALSFNRRQRELCAVAADHLALGSDDGIILAEDLRRSSHALAEILGVNATESMLDALFDRFCIGK